MIAIAIAIAIAMAAMIERKVIGMNLKRRHVIAEDISYDVFSLAIDEKRIAYRILVAANSGSNVFVVADDAVDTPVDKLKTTEKLGTEFAYHTKKRTFTINGEKYVILVEILIDKNDRRYKGSWIPGCHFACQFDGDKIQAHNIGSLNYFTLMNTISAIRQRGGFWGFDFWIRDCNAPMTKLARSITTKENSIIITNVEDLGDKWKVEDVVTGKTSRWLSLDYELTADKETVEPDGWVEFTFKVYDGKTGDLASDVSWHNYIIEPVDGYAPHRRFEVKNGVGSFKMRALCLVDGETMRVKVNRRFATGLAECTVKISNK